MKKITLLLAVLLPAFALMGQQLLPQTKVTRNQQTTTLSGDYAIRISDVRQPAFTGNPDLKGRYIPNVIPIGTSANARTYGYHGGQKTMVWADDNLKTIINVHRMGPGTTPNGLSGYLAVDMGTNGAQTPGDWQLNHQIYASTLDIGFQYLADAARYPQAVLYNPTGNTNPENAYITYFTANYLNNGWGGYSYGVANVVDQADSTKHLQWFSPPPYTYIPEGMSISRNGVVLVVDKSYDETDLYHGQLIVNRGIWNPALKDFEYTQTALDCPTTDNHYPACTRVAFSPDGETAWIVTLANNGGAIMVGDSANYYPVLFRSADAGQTWDDPIAIQLDGPTGIPAVLNYLSDFRITELYGELVPRDQIPYTTAFDFDLVVDKWGNPHIGVVVGVSAGEYTIASGDSAFAVFDLYTVDDGNNWHGVVMGHPWTFRGELGDEYEDQRTNMATNTAGDKVFITWQDTQQQGIDDNIFPDVFIRGFDLLTNKITSLDGEDQPINMTLLTDVYQQAYFHCTSHYVFTEPDGYIIPVCTMLPSDIGNMSAPVTFHYLANFKLIPEQYTIPVANPPFPVGVGEVYNDFYISQCTPNPVSGEGRITLQLPRPVTVSITLMDMTGRTRESRSMNLPAGQSEVVLDLSGWTPGVYFCTALFEDHKVTRKIIVR